MSMLVYRQSGLLKILDTISWFLLCFDHKTDATLRKRLKEVTGDATVLIVAQRVGTIMDADQIIVLDQGEIVGRGTHDELMESNEIYREIANSQLDSPSLTEE